MNQLLLMSVAALVLSACATAPTLAPTDSSAARKGEGLAIVSLTLSSKPL